MGLKHTLCIWCFLPSQVFFEINVLSGPTINIIFILSSISRGSLFWLVKQISINENSALAVFKYIKDSGLILIRWPNWTSGTKEYNTLDFCWWVLLTKLQWTKTTSALFIFGTSSQSLSLLTSFFELLNNFCVFSVNSSLYLVFILNVILFFISLA